MSVYHRFTDPSGVVWVTIHCGCCGMYFNAPVGGTCFCKGCRDGLHLECKIMDIMGIQR
jgi:hypothetical protein